MPTISDLVVLVRADTKQFQAGMTQAQATTERSTAGMASSTSKFGTIATAAFGVAAIAVVKFVSDSVESAKEHERVMTQLKIAVGGSTKAFEDQATSLQNLTGFQDEEVLAADTVLARFKLTGQQIRELTPLVLDYARATGTDAASAASNLGKAMLGNTRALKTIGIQFTATGDRGKDFATIMAALEDRVGGASEAFGKTLEGRMAIFDAQLDDVKEAIGFAVLPLLLKLVTALNDLATVLVFAANGFDDFDKKVQTAATHLGEFELNIGGTLSKFVTGNPLIKGAADIWHAFRGSTDEATKALDAAAPATQGAAAATAELSGKLAEAAQKARNFGHMTNDALKKFSEDVVGSVTDAIGSLTSFDKKFALTAHNAILHARGMQEKAKDIAKDYKALDTEAIPDKFKAWLLQQGPDAVHAFIKANQQGKNDIEQAWKSIEASLKKTTNTIKDILGTGGRQAGVAFGDGMASGIGSRLTWIGAAARNAAHAAITAAKNELGAESPSKEMHKVGIDFMQGLINGIESMVSRFDEVIGKVAEQAVKHFSSDLDKLKAKMQGWRDDIQSGFKGFNLLGGLMGLEEGQDPAAFLQQQLMAAQQFGAALRGLQDAGLRGGLLRQLASQGPAALGTAQTLLADPALLAQLNATAASIARISGATQREILGEQFDKSIDRLGNRLERVINRVGNIDIHIQGWVGNDQALAQKLRDELLKLQARNVTTGIT